MQWVAMSVAGALAIGLGLSGTARSADDLPPLNAPEAVPPAVDLAPALPPPTGPTASPTVNRGPVLALPGVTPPRSAVRVAPVPDDMPSLDAPAGMGAPASRPASPRPAAGLGDGRPLVLESVPAEEFHVRSVEPAAEIGSKPRLNDAIANEPPPVAPGRRPNLLGRGGSRPGPAGIIRPRSGRMENSVRVEPKRDPAADAELERTVERQATLAVGRNAKAVEVRVVGRTVYLRASGVRFLQRRGVRRSLESLPGLAGYRPIIDLAD